MTEHQEGAAPQGEPRQPGENDSTNPVQECPTTFRDRVSHLSRHVYGSLLMRRIQYRNRSIVRDIRPLAMHLEHDVFPLVREERQEWFWVEIQCHEGKPRLAGSSGSRTFSFPGTDACATWLSDQRIARLRLSTRLESGQILEALLLLVHTIDYLGTARPNDENYPGWDPELMAGAMVSPTGYHKFCAALRYHQEAHVYEVGESYCELMFSRMVTSYVERHSPYGDHRALFHTVPRSIVLTWLLLMLLVPLFLLNPVAGVIATMAVATLGAVAAGLAVHTLASVQYAREHYNLLGDELLRQVGNLSRFPETNPNPVFKLSKEGEITYTNPSARKLIEELGLGEEGAKGVLPPNCNDLLRECTEEGAECVEVDLETCDRFLHYRFSPFYDEPSVIATAADVTYLKRIEEELRGLNESLEEKVQNRTTELRETQDVTILCLAGLAETRDQETGQHLERTRLYVKVLAEHLRTHPSFEEYLNDRTIEMLFKCTPLHDIGKVGVRDAILLKPAKLTPEEFEEMKRHTTYGGDALRWANERLGFDSFLRIGQDIAYGHHERWDGTGYPKGLAGDKTPWAARLMALADVYDALASKRVYKSAFSIQMTRDMIVDGRGSHFDPAVVDAFLACEEEFEHIAKTYGDA
jgi:response regulator RpfG family c-di-GMP phosphodiesterase